MYYFLLFILVLCVLAFHLFVCSKISKIRGGEDSKEIFLISFFSPLLGLIIVIAQLIRDHNEDYVGFSDEEDEE